MAFLISVCFAACGNDMANLTAVQNRYSMMARHYEPLFPVLEMSEVFGGSTVKSRR